MALLTVKGIVTRYANYKENDRMLTLLTAELGSVSASARGCRRMKSPLLPASELFVYGEFVLFYNHDRYSVNTVEVQETFYPLREDMDRLNAAMFMLELINAGSATAENAETPLEQLYYALSYTAYSEMSPLDMALCFAARYLSGLGFLPAVTACAVCGQDLRQKKELWFLPDAGGAVCGECGAQGIPVSPLSMEALRRMLLLSNDDVRKVVLPEQVRSELKQVLGAYASEVLERRLKTLELI